MDASSLLSAPSSPITVWNVLDFGADPTGKILSHTAFERAIHQVAALSSKGSSHKNVVLVPAGTYLIRPMQLFSHMTLHLEPGAFLQADNTDMDYILRRRNHHHQENEEALLWPLAPIMSSWGVDEDQIGKDTRYESLVWASHVQDLLITGTTGVINGGGPLWWHLYGTKQLSWSRPHLMEIRHSDNVLIDGIRLEEAPFWTLNIYNCTNLHIQNIDIYNPQFGTFHSQEQDGPSSSSVVNKSRAYNVDGIDLTSCVHCVVRDSNIDTQDDAICVKSGLNRAGIRAHLPSKDILVQNNTLRSWAAAGLAVGSEMSSGVYNVTFEDCRVRKSRYGVRIKSTRGRGGMISNITFQNIDIQEANRAAIAFHMEGGRHPGYIPIWSGWRVFDVSVFQDVDFVGITMDDMSRQQAGIVFEGLYRAGTVFFDRAPIRRITFHDDDINPDQVHVECLNAAHVKMNGQDIPCRAGLLYLQDLSDWFVHKVLVPLSATFRTTDVEPMMEKDATTNP